MADITYGSKYVFNAFNTNYISSSLLDSTHFVVAYMDDGGDDYGCCRIGTISGSTITYGSEYIFNSANTSNVSVSTLDSTHFVIGYTDVGNGSKGTSTIGVVSNDDEITYGSEYLFNDASTTDVSVSTLDSTHFVIGYRDVGNSSKGTAIIGTLSSGNQIAYGSEYIFNDASTANVSVSSLDSTHFVVAYVDINNSKKGTAIIGVVSSVDTITFGSEYIFNNIDTNHTSVSTLDSTHFVIGYTDVGDTYGKAIIGVVSLGDEIAYGGEYAFNSGTNYLASVLAMDSTHFIVVYRYSGNSNKGLSILGTISGTNISYGDEIVFNSANAYPVSITKINSTNFIISYRDFAEVDWDGTSIIGTTAEVTTTDNSIFFGMNF